MSTTVTHIASTDSSAKTHALIAYILLILGLFTAIPMLFGGVWAMVKRKSSSGTLFHSHYTNAIRTFWWTVAWTIFGIIMIPVFVGYAILCAVWFWALYRLINGMARIVSDEPYPL